MRFGKQNLRPDLPIDRDLASFVEAQVAESPEAVAIRMGQKALTFRELNERSNRLAHFLRQQRIDPGKIVGVLIDRSVEMVVCLLGILKSGGVYLPLDPKFPKDRLAFMIGDAEAAVLLTQLSYRDDLPATDAKIVAIEEFGDLLAGQPAGNPQPVNNPRDAAYVIYTSGSTGNPKGVMIPRRALANFLLSMAEEPGVTAQDKLLAVTTISFDISFLEMLLPLITGAEIVVAAREQTGDPFALRQLLDEHNITVMQATPTTWRLLLESGWEGKPNLKILCGGEALTVEMAERLLPRCHELWNMYGPTETTVWSSTERVTSAQNITLGHPIANTALVVVHEDLRPVAPGETGELLIGGDGLALGYLKREELTAQRFIPDTVYNVEGARLYRTGDEVRQCADGTLEFLGRLDHQVKLNGFRIELGEIESAIARIEGVRQAVVILREDVPGDKRLVAYYTGKQDLDTNEVLAALRTGLPEYMVPSAFVWMAEFPQTPNAKLDRKALPAPARKRPQLAQDYIAPFTESEKQMAALWQEMLRIDQIGIDDSFFDLGGNSIAVFRMISAYRSRYQREIPPVKVFQYPTIAQLCDYLARSEDGESAVADALSRTSHRRGRGKQAPESGESIAVVGMVGRFPGADNLDQLWRNLRESRESISFFTPEELSPGVDDRYRTASDYVRARGIIEGVDLFDPAFFGISPLEARVMDPQQRLFLEQAYNALENAGYDPSRYRGLIGVYAGIGDNHYYTANLLTHPDLLARAGKLAVEYGNQKDYIALRTAYLLDLRGPAISLNTACSTTLLAVDMAYRGLLDYECDMALAGGIDITIPHKSGFLYTEGGTFTRDGHCRPFDADATGTMFCDGSGVVVLKRLSDALKDGDRIYAVLHGTGKNNNGSRPASFLAPSAEGQAEAVAMAQANAGIDVERIGYIEAHGTGTPVGDPIEIEALNSVFGKKTQKRQYCYIGSIKGNVGHPTNAAGVAGFIKAAMVLDREEIPPTLHYKTPNPRINFAESPFIVADKLIPYKRGPQPRYTAVSSFGFGGTNVHAILGEAPLPTPGSELRPMQLFPISARTAGSLDALSASLADHFQSAPESEFADTAFTLQTGRKQMAMRRIVVASNPAEAARLLQQPDPRRVASRRCERRDPPVVFLFGGQGTQYVNMGQNLYADEPLFRAVVDDCCEILKPHLGRDLREMLYPRPDDEETAAISLQDTFYTQPSLFVIEYALARLWQSLGIQPAVMAGHSIGEFVAATLADVWDLEDVLRIVAHRGRLMQSLPRGTMMSVRANAESIVRRLPPEVQIASNNAPSLCVISGPDESVQAVRQQFEAENIVCRPLYTSHAFHSSMMDPMVEPLRTEIAKVKLRPPLRPVVSTVTGKMMTAAEATSADYWAHQARATVAFSDATLTLKEQGHKLFLECGPRSTLCALTRQHFSPAEGCIAIPTLSDTHQDNQEWALMLFALGSLWLNGVTVDWDAFYANEDRRRVPLPTYPFERQSYWVDPAQTVAAPVSANVTAPAAIAPLSAPPSSPAIAVSAAATRKERLVARLLELIAPITGYEPDTLSSSALFVEQGFDSLSLVQVSVEIEHEFGIKLGFSKLMNQFPTVEMVAAHLDEVLPEDVTVGVPAPASAAAPVPAAAPLLPALAVAPGHADPSVLALAAAVAEQGRILASIQETLARMTSTSAPTSAAAPEPALSAPAAPVTVPTTAPQRGIYYSSHLSQNLSASYNESVTLHIDGQIDVPKIQRSLERLVERHDALRASFDASGLAMRIEPAIQFDTPVQDLSTTGSPAELQEKLKHLAIQETAIPFALPQGPLFRTTLYLLGPSTAAVVLTAHHIICDGWSLDVLIQDFCSFYSEELSGPKSSRPRLAAPSFAEYASHSDERAHSQEFKAAREYWERKFSSGLPTLSLPADLERKPLREHRAVRVDRLIGTQVVDRLRALATEQGSSLFAVSVAALGILLARLSRQTRFVLALSTAEQPFLGKPELVGHCVSLLPFLIELHPGEDVTGFIQRIQRELAEAMDHLSFTTIHLMDEIVSSSRTRMSPIPIGLTGIKKFRPDELDLRGFSFDYHSNPKSFESFEWYLSTHECSEGLEVHAHYDVELFRHDTIEQWLASFESIFEQMLAAPSANAFALAQFTPEAAPVEGQIFKWIGHSDSEPDTSSELLSTNSVASGSTNLLPQLVTLFQRVLGRRAISPDDNFFDLGGHSVNAARLFAIIERELHITAPLATLYETPTPRKLAGVLAGGVFAERWQSLVPIRASGTRPPLFLVHGAEGNVLLYRNLASHLGDDQPVYGLQSAGLDGKSTVDGNIVRVARQYVEEIRSIQPEGTYFLGGYCLGGVIAMEMARELLRQGQSIGLVAMIEAFNIRSVQWPLPFRVRMANKLFLNPYYHLQNILEADGAHRVDFFRQKLDVEIARAKVEARVLWGKATRSMNGHGAEEFHHLKIADVWDKALVEHDIVPYPGEITLFTTERTLMGMSAPNDGWTGLASSIREFKMPFSPKASMTEPYVRLVAQRLSACIAEAATRSKASGEGAVHAGVAAAAKH